MSAESIPTPAMAQSGVREVADGGWLVRLGAGDVTTATSTGKKLAAAIGSLCAQPHILSYAIGRRLLGEQRAFTAASERISRLAGLLGIYTRQAFYRRALSRIGRDVYLGFGSVFSKSQTTLGDRVYIGRFCSIGWAEIGDDVMLADGVQVLSGRHQHGRASDTTLPRDQQQAFTKVTIGHGAWLGAGAIIMADVGERAVVGAGAVVVKPAPAGTTVAGVPAVAIDSR